MQLIWRALRRSIVTMITKMPNDYSYNHLIIQATYSRTHFFRANLRRYLQNNSYRQLCMSCIIQVGPLTLSQTLLTCLVEDLLMTRFKQITGRAVTTVSLVFQISLTVHVTE